LLKRYSALEPGGGLKVVTLVGGVGIQLKRHPDVWSGTKFAHIETLVDDSKDDVAIAAQRNRLADDGRIAAKTAGPEVVTEQGDIGAARRILLRAKGAAPQNWCTEAAEVIGRYLGRTELFRHIAFGVVHHAVPERGDVFEDTRL
jgi:hypothetical protein